MSLLVRDAVFDGARVDLRTADGAIAELGTRLEPGTDDEVFDADGLVLLPGFVNGHTHAAMTLLRGYGDDLQLDEWLQTRIWPVEARLTDDDVYWGTRLAAVEMIRSGTVHLWDMYWHAPAVARALEHAGLRGAVSQPLLDGLDPARVADLRAEALAGLAELEATGPLITACLGPHSIYTVSEESLAFLGELSAERDVPVHIHCAETRTEVDDCVAAHGVRTVPYLDRVGLLTTRTVLAHGVWLDDAELELVAERGATIVTNPVSNLKLAVGEVFRYRAARARGISVGLGTDGPASNNSLDLLQDVKVLALLQKHATRDPAALPAHEAFDVLTGRLAGRLGQSGRIAVGEPADFVLVRGAAPELAPGNLLANLVYAASGAVVDTTVVAGRVLMRGRMIEGEEEVRVRAVECAQRLGIA